MPQSQDEATKPQGDTAKRRWLARFVDHLTWQQATGVAFGAFIAPMVTAIILINISGATLLDGLFGIYRNSPLQSSIVGLSMLAVPLGPLCALIFAIIFCHEAKGSGRPKTGNAARIACLHIFNCPAVCVTRVVTCPHKTAANIAQLTLFMFC